MNRILLTPLLLMVLATNSAFCQNDWKSGYIIKNQGDTVFGFIDNRDSRSNSKQCYFRKDENGETQIFEPKDIAGYRFTNDKFFVSKTIEGVGLDHPVFLEFLIHGRVNVYHYKDDNDRYFLEKEAIIYELKNTSELITLESKNYLKEKKEYKGLLIYLLSDAKMSQDIEKSIFKSQSLIGIAKKYHEKVCTDEKCIVYERMEKPIHVNCGFHAGLTLNSMSFGSDVTSNYSVGSALGVKFEFENVLPWRENISLSLDFTLQRFTNYTFTQKGEGYTIIDYNDVRYYLTSNNLFWGVKSLDVDLKALAIKIPFTVNYTFSKGKLRPYAGAGFDNIFVISQNKNFIFHGFYQAFNKSIPIYHYGFVGKVGAKNMLKNNRSVYFEVNYEPVMKLNVNESLRFNNNIFSFYAGYSF